MKKKIFFFTSDILNGLFYIQLDRNGVCWDMVKYTLPITQLSKSVKIFLYALWLIKYLCSPN